MGDRGSKEKAGIPRGPQPPPRIVRVQNTGRNARAPDERFDRLMANLDALATEMERFLSGETYTVAVRRLVNNPLRPVRPPSVT